MDLNSLQTTLEFRAKIIASKQKELNKAGFFQKRRIKKQIQALEEAQHQDILNTTVAASASQDGEVRGNNYRTYSGQVQISYDMYNSETKYGTHTYRGVTETRVAFIGGEGISYRSDKKATQNYIKKLFEANNLTETNAGSKLLDMLTTGELEGKCLLVLKPDNKTQTVQIKVVDWKNNSYTVEPMPDDNKEIKSIYIGDDTQADGKRKLNQKNTVYVKLGGTPDKLNETTTRVHTVLTQIENVDRALYDLRANNHLFSKLTPYFKTDNPEASKAINNAITNSDWEVGRGYAGQADFSIVGPTTTCADVINQEITLNTRVISVASGVPIHWLAWPDLMSNRATAENLLEVVNSATLQERARWEEAIKDVIQKSMDMAIDAGYETNAIKGEFVVKLTLISLASLKALQETWLPLQQADIVSMHTLRTKVPGIDAANEDKLIEKEKEANMARSPFANKVVNGQLEEAQKEGEEVEDTGTDTGQQERT
jgi:hypothetical protein